MKMEVITPLDLEDFVKRIESLEEDSKLHDSLIHDISDKEPYAKKE